MKNKRTNKIYKRENLTLMSDKFAKMMCEY